MNDFKWRLQEAQIGAESTMRALIEERPEGFYQACSDVLEVKEALDKTKDVVQNFNKVKERYDSNCD